MNEDMLARIESGTGFIAIHQMRTRVITSPVFNGDRTLAAILSEQTMDRQIAGLVPIIERELDFHSPEKGRHGEAAQGRSSLTSTGCPSGRTSSSS